MTPELAVAGLVIAFSQVVKGVTGFGSALVAVPLLTLLWGPREAVFVCACADLVGGIWLAYDVRRELHLALVGAMAVLMVPGQWIGTELLTRLPEAVIAGGMGIIVGVLAIELLWRPVKEGRGEWTDLPPDRRDVLGYGGIAGFAGGLMSGAVGAAGPPVVIFLRHYFADAFFRAQCIGIFTVTATTLPAMLLFKGTVETTVLTKVAWVLVPMIVGNRLGAFLAGRFSRVTFARMVGVLLLGAAAALLVR